MMSFLSMKTALGRPNCFHVGDEQAAGGVDGDPVRFVELALALAFLAPGLAELAVLGIFDDPRVGLIAMAVGAEYIAVRRGHHVGRRADLMVAATAYPRA